jgi:hypothetical protein
MKTFGILISMVLLWVSCTKGTNPPVAVITTFNQMFPVSVHVSWSQEGSREYEAEFIKDGIEMSASFTPDGKWMETESEISASNVPSVVMDKFNKLYPKHRKLEAFKIDKPDGTIIYELEFRKCMMTKEVAFDSLGNQK